MTSLLYFGSKGTHSITDEGKNIYFTYFGVNLHLLSEVEEVMSWIVNRVSKQGRKKKLVLHMFG